MRRGEEAHERGYPADYEAEAITLACALLEADCAQVMAERCPEALPERAGARARRVAGPLPGPTCGERGIYAPGAPPHHPLPAGE